MTRRSDSTSENITFGMTTYLFKVCANGSLHCCDLLCETRKILERATPTMGSISRSIPYPYLGLAEEIILANQVLRCQGICAMMPKMSETWEYQRPWCYATEEQPSVGNFRRMGKWIHESFPMPEHRKYILVAMDTTCPNGLKHFLCCGRLEKFKEDGLGNHVSLLWISKSHV